MDKIIQAQNKKNSAKKIKFTIRRVNLPKIVKDNNHDSTNCNNYSGVINNTGEFSNLEESTHREANQSTISKFEANRSYFNNNSESMLHHRKDSGSRTSLKSAFNSLNNSKLRQ